MMMMICLFVLTWSTNVTDTHTDRHTDTAWRHMPRLRIASRGKNTASANRRYRLSCLLIFDVYLAYWLRLSTACVCKISVSVCRLSSVWNHKSLDLCFHWLSTSWLRLRGLQFVERKTTYFIGSFLTRKARLNALRRRTLRRLRIK